MRIRAITTSLAVIITAALGFGAATAPTAEAATCSSPPPIAVTTVNGLTPGKMVVTLHPINGNRVELVWKTPGSSRYNQSHVGSGRTVVEVNPEKISGWLIARSVCANGVRGKGTNVHRMVEQSSDYAQTTIEIPRHYFSPAARALVPLVQERLASCVIDKATNAAIKKLSTAAMQNGNPYVAATGSVTKAYQGIYNKAAIDGCEGAKNLALAAADELSVTRKKDGFLIIVSSYTPSRWNSPPMCHSHVGGTGVRVRTLASYISTDRPGCLNRVNL